MDADKLNEAAEKYAHENAWYPGETSYESDIIAMEESFSDTFKQGASWLMQQPLSDRLTEEEKERIKKLYLTDEEIDGVKSAFGAYPVAAATITKNILEQIFSKEQFNQPTEV